MARIDAFSWVHLISKSRIVAVNVVSLKCAILQYSVASTHSFQTCIHEQFFCPYDIGRAYQRLPRSHRKWAWNKYIGWCRSISVSTKKLNFFDRNHLGKFRLHFLKKTPNIVALIDPSTIYLVNYWEVQKTLMTDWLTWEIPKTRTKFYCPWEYKLFPLLTAFYIFTTFFKTS